MVAWKGLFLGLRISQAGNGKSNEQDVLLAVLDRAYRVWLVILGGGGLLLSLIVLGEDSSSHGWFMPVAVVCCGVASEIAKSALVWIFVGKWPMLFSVRSL